jgi:hypothetical protein
VNQCDQGPRERSAKRRLRLSTFENEPGKRWLGGKSGAWDRVLDGMNMARQRQRRENMKCRRLGSVAANLALLCALGSTLCLSGCSGEAEGTDEASVQQLDGVYALESFTRNEAGCDAEGESVVDALQQQYFVIRRLSSPIAYTMVAACAEPAACHELGAAIASHQSFSSSWSLTLGYQDDAGYPRGHEVSSGLGTSDGMCTDRVIQDTLTSQPEANLVRLETRTFPLPDQPQDSDGFCVARPDEPTPSDAACAMLEVATGRLVEPL